MTNAGRFAVDWPAPAENSDMHIKPPEVVVTANEIASTIRDAEATLVSIARRAESAGAIGASVVRYKCFGSDWLKAANRMKTMLAGSETELSLAGAMIGALTTLELTPLQQARVNAVQGLLGKVGAQVTAVSKATKELDSADPRWGYGPRDASDIGL